MSESLDTYRQAAHELMVEHGPADTLGLHVTGYSMTPLLQPGDLVHVKPVPLDELRLGDIIVVRRQADTITHRLIARDSRTWHTKGDNCHDADPPVAGPAIMGRAVGFERDGVQVDLTSPRWMAASRWLSRLGRGEAAVARRWRSSLAPGQSANLALQARLAAWPFRVLLCAAIKLMLIWETRRV